MSGLQGHKLGDLEILGRILVLEGQMNNVQKMMYSSLSLLILCNRCSFFPDYKSNMFLFWDIWETAFGMCS